MKYIHGAIISLFLSTFFLLVIASCANKGQGPQGGPKDTIPPSVVKSLPANKALNFNKKKVEIIFDENIVVQKVAEKVIISPPQHTTPSIQAYGKTIVVQFNDTLKSNTTYSINFGDAIVDNNENNPLKNFVFAFSTGNTIDTLQMSGTLINAENLNPMSGIVVGIYDNLADSSFYKEPFLRITKTDDNGTFIVPNVKEGKYKVRALKDDNRDNMLQTGESLAFNETLYSPSFEIYDRRDTIWKDSVTVDTVKIVKATRFLPNDILLRFFKENNKKQRFVKAERKERNHFILYFNAPSTELPMLDPIDFDWNDKALLQKNETLDTLTYWIKDTELMKKDTLSFKMKYLKTDSLNNLSYTTDTIHLVMRKTKPNQKDAEAGAKNDKKNFLSVRSNLSRDFDVYVPIRLSFDVPIKTLDSTKIYLSEMRDTIPIPLKFKINKKDDIGLSYEIYYSWKPEATYLLQMDSAAIYNIYGVNNDKFKNDFRIKSLDDYSSMKLSLEKYEPTAVYQILNKNDEVVRSVPAGEKGTVIKYLQPGDYYIRLFMDRNGNGKWDTGNYNKQLQPEEVYYYPKKLTLIKNWDFEETIDFNKTPLLQQKPKELIKKDSKDNNRTGNNN